MSQHTLTVTLSQQEREINLTLALVIEGEGGVRVPALFAFLNDRAFLSVRHGSANKESFGQEIDTLLSIQTASDVAKARDRKANISVERSRPKQSAAKQQTFLASERQSLQGHRVRRGFKNASDDFNVFAITKIRNYLRCPLPSMASALA